MLATDERLLIVLTVVFVLIGELKSKKMLAVLEIVVPMLRPEISFTLY